MGVKIDDYAKPAGKRGDRDYYHWRVFVDEPDDRLREIESVVYTLHPTFPEPTRTRTDPATKFALETSGWGEFNILVTVRYIDGRKETTQYWLDLSKPWPVEA